MFSSNPSMHPESLGARPNGKALYIPASLNGHQQPAPGCGERPGASATRVDHAALVRIGTALLTALGEDPTRPGLQDTPRRFADWWAEFIDYDPGRTETVFESGACDQIVVVSGIRVWSICEHHLLPFWCDLSIGYVPDGEVLGLSKFARVGQQFAHRLQIQERLVSEVANEIERLSGSRDVAVVGRGEHLCMTIRGIKTQGTMTTSVLRGAFRDCSATRGDFLRMVGC